MKYFDSFMAASKLSGLANWFGSFTLSWPCMRDRNLVLVGERRHLFAAVRVEDAVITFTPIALAIWKPRSISSSVKLSLKLRL